ncbi:PIN domain-containing protein [Rhodoferax sp.]|uniref:PIN domain-containing protein n=1 Tax=Rhodoferax sp. TaxID=50421 RepID=UPI00262D7435|nr:PIN domain-containing protein [Rhodoferax sp.]MDD4944290.1 PIN domain-containing protein [Rhodoferax sp.]MDD5478228.1 PIN domain-containing protein [Rhodoferax sp.]
MSHKLPSPLWLLDTNILSKLIKQPDGALAQRMREVSDAHPGALVTSLIVECELRFGATRVNSLVLDSKISNLLKLVPVLPLNAHVVPHYATLRTQLERQGTPIGPNDTLIAAHALALSATLVSGDAEFARVPGLMFENWLAECSST